MLHLTLALSVVAGLLSSVALAGGSKPKTHHKGSSGCVSATCVYHEGQTSLSGRSGQKGPPVALSSSAAARLAAQGGKDTRALEAIATSRFFGVRPPLPGEAASVGDVNAPGAFLAALDLGPGPIALFVTLLAGAAAFGLGGALRRRRGSSV